MPPVRRGGRAAGPARRPLPGPHAGEHEAGQGEDGRPPLK